MCTSSRSTSRIRPRNEATPGCRSYTRGQTGCRGLRPEDRFLATHTITPRGQNSIPAHSHPPRPDIRGLSRACERFDFRAHRCRVVPRLGGLGLSECLDSRRITRWPNNRRQLGNVGTSSFRTSRARDRPRSGVNRISHMVNDSVGPRQHPRGAWRGRKGAAHFGHSAAAASMSTRRPRQLAWRSRPVNSR